MRVITCFLNCSYIFCRHDGVYAVWLARECPLLGTLMQLKFVGAFCFKLMVSFLPSHPGCQWGVESSTCQAPGDLGRESVGVSPPVAGEGMSRLTSGFRSILILTPFHDLVTHVHVCAAACEAFRVHCSAMLAEMDEKGLVRMATSS